MKSMTLKVSCRESCKEVYSDLNSMFRSLNSCLQSLDAHSLGSVLKCDAMKASFQLLQIILHLCKVHPRQDIEQNSSFEGKRSKHFTLSIQGKLNNRC